LKYCDTCHSAYPDDFTICPRDQGALRQAADLVPGMVIRGKYEILSKVGSGGMASVYKARHVAFGEVVALKLVGTRLAGDADFLKRFRNEAIVTRRLQHPNAVHVDDLDSTEDGRPFIVMEYVDGRSLRELVRAEGPQPLARAVSVTRQVCSALAAAHALGITHRDIKPDNVLLGRGPDGAEHVKVLDFGIAKVREASEGAGEGYTPTRTGMIVGTPQYISPEQAMGKRGDEVDGRADLYSLGVVLYEMVTGRLPFHSDTAMGMLLHHLQTAPTPPSLARPDLDIPAPLSDVLMRALQKDREQRFASATEMLAALDRVAALPLPEAPPLEWPAVPIMTPPPVRTPSGAPTPRPLTPTELAQIEAQPTKMMPSTPTPAPTMLNATPTVMEPARRKRERRWWQWVAASGVIVFAMCSGLCARVCNDGGDEKRPASPAPAAGGDASGTVAGQVREGVKELMQEIDDDTIEEAVQERLGTSKVTSEHELSVNVHDGVVTLDGKVPDPGISMVAQALAETVPGVKEVRNKIRAPEDPRAQGGRQPQVPPPGPVMPVPPAPRAPGTGPIDPNSPEGEALQELLKRGREAIESEHPELALRHYGSALSIDPNNVEAKEGLEKAATAMATNWTKRLPFRFGPPPGQQRRHPRGSEPPSAPPTSQPTPEP
jgi:serine/threonine-protein kinase